MTASRRFHWGRVVVAILAAEVLPVLALVAVVVIFGFLRAADSPSPEEFAPRAGFWVGPIGGFLATLLFGWWAAKGALPRPILHGTLVGLGTAILDFSMALQMGGDGPIHPVLFVSNGGRILAGALGGWLASRAETPVQSQNLSG